MRLWRKEVISLYEWFMEHKKTCPQNGWDVEFEQSSKSGIGTNTYVKCICGVKADITDYGSW